MDTSDARGYLRLVACLKTLRNSEVRVKSFCQTSFDGVLCWPPAPPGMTVRQPCPSVTGFITGRYAYRTCGANSDWIRLTDSFTWGPVLQDIVDEGDGFTDYKDCMNISMEATPRYTGIQDLAGVSNIEILGYVLHSVSIIALFVSICIYGCCVPAITQRYKIFIPMFLSAMLKSIIYLAGLIVWRFEHETDQTTFWRDPIVCKVWNALTRFSEISVYSWIAVLGVYYLFAVLGDIIKDRRVIVLYLVGLGIPVVFATAWALTVSFVLSSDMCNGGQIPHATHWITDAPRLACVLIAFCIFIVCVYAACRDLLDPDVPEFRFVKQGTINCLILLLISTTADLYQLVTVYNQGGRSNLVVKSTSWTGYMTVVVEGIMGAVIALLLCFLDKEVWLCGEKSRKDNVNIILVEGGEQSENY